MKPTRSTRTGPTVHDDLLAQRAGKLVGNDPRDDARASTWRKCVDPLSDYPTTLVRLVCTKCGRAGRLSLEGLIAEHGAKGRSFGSNLCARPYC